MKHAYLIIAHHEFEVLQKLVGALDDDRNDIYIHFDKKLVTTPKLVTNRSTLHVIDNRVDIRWGHVSQIEGEYCLFEESYKQEERYDFYHLISGVHLPLYSQDYLHAFFDSRRGKQIFMPMTTSDFQTDLKMRRYNLFTKTFAHKHKTMARLSQLAWNVAHRIQRKLDIKRFKHVSYAYASNWVSITEEAVAYLLENKKEILRKYRYTFCGDEYFVPTELLHSGLSWDVKYDERLLLHEVGNAHAKTFGLSDYPLLINSERLFARKFSAKHIGVVDQIIDTLKDRK